MSEKRMKEDRKRANTPVIKVTIDVFSDNRVEVGGFPGNYAAAVDLMQAATRRVMNHFMMLGVEGRLDERLSIKQSDIIQPQRPPIVLSKPH